MEIPEFFNGGKFISRGRGRHPARVIDSWELIAVVSGELGISELDREYRVRPGEFLFLSPGVRHAGIADYRADLSFFWGHYRRDFPAPGIVCGRFARPAAAAEYFSLLIAEQQYPDNHAACNLLLALLLNETRRASPPENSPARLAEAAERLFRLRFADNLSTAGIARELGCNPDYLGRMVRFRYGCAPLELLNRIRLDRCAALLGAGAVSVKEVAAACGFNDPAYFRRRFLRRFSMTPREYRALHAPGHVNTD